MGSFDLGCSGPLVISTPGLIVNVRLAISSNFLNAGSASASVLE